MLSPSGKVEWSCCDCGSKDIVRSNHMTIFEYTDSNDNLFECKACGFFAKWSNRIKRSMNGLEK